MFLDCSDGCPDAPKDDDKKEKKDDKEQPRFKQVAASHDDSSKARFQQVHAQVSLEQQIQQLETMVATAQNIAKQLPAKVRASNQN